MPSFPLQHSPRPTTTYMHQTSNSQLWLGNSIPESFLALLWPKRLNGNPQQPTNLNEPTTHKIMGKTTARSQHWSNGNTQPKREWIIHKKIMKEPTSPFPNYGIRTHTNHECSFTGTKSWMIEMASPALCVRKNDGENPWREDEQNYRPCVRMENNGRMGSFPSFPREVKGSASGVCMWARIDSPATHHCPTITSQLTSEVLML